MDREVLVGKIYKHFKGNNYKVLCIAKDSENLKEIVVYQALYGENQIWTRTKEDFLSLVDKNKYKDIKQKYRFELVK